MMASKTVAACSQPLLLKHCLAEAELNKRGLLCRTLMSVPGSTAAPTHAAPSPLWATTSACAMPDMLAALTRTSHPWSAR
jgi:hypothetical protein